MAPWRDEAQRGETVAEPPKAVNNRFPPSLRKNLSPSQKNFREFIRGEIFVNVVGLPLVKFPRLFGGFLFAELRAKDEHERR